MLNRCASYALKKATQDHKAPRIKYRRLTEFGPPLWQAEADNVSSMSASTATAAGQILLEYHTVIRQLQNKVLKRNVNFIELRRSRF